MEKFYTVNFIFVCDFSTKFFLVHDLKNLLEVRFFYFCKFIIGVDGT